MQGAGGGHDNRQVIAVVAGCAHMFDNIIPSLVQGGGHGNRQVIAVVVGCTHMFHNLIHWCRAGAMAIAKS
jgi:hypothetical protein